MVYVSALAPGAGENTSQQYEGFAETPDFVIDVGEDGFGFLDHDRFQAGFAHDASEADAAFLRDSQVPINMAVFGEKVEHAAWETKPSWAVIATEDHAFDVAMLRHMAQRIGAEITEVATSHAVFMTRADVVAETIERAAQAAVAAGR
nr:alpha/beta fold hydrolase [Microbacterium gallinarum]